MVVPVGFLQFGLAQPRVEHPVVQDLAGTFRKSSNRNRQAVNGGTTSGPI